MKRIKTGAGGEIYSNPKVGKLINYGLDVADQLSAMLSNELAKEIDKDILNSLGIYCRNIRRMNSIDKIFKDVE